jgi:hypothetical protein
MKISKLGKYFPEVGAKLSRREKMILPLAKICL